MPITAMTDPLTGGSNIASDELRLLIERIERLAEDKKGIADDIKDVYAEAKAHGYDTRTMRRVIAACKMDKQVREEADAMFKTYMASLGFL